MKLEDKVQLQQIQHRLTLRPPTLADPGAFVEAYDPATGQHFIRQAGSVVAARSNQRLGVAIGQRVSLEGGAFDHQ